MSISGFLRRVRGALGTAVVWAGTWALGSLVLSTSILFMGVVLPFSFLRFAFMMALNAAGPGFLAGAFFSVYLGIAGRNKTLGELSAFRFGLGGAVVAGLLVPALAVLGSGFAILGLPPQVLAFMMGIPAIMGGATAFGTIKIAQHGAKQLTEPSLRELEAEQGEVERLLG